ncbi:Helicase, C-terminal [Ostreococcus tauri]|uniref:RNA helicase n=1 Tax=Ostreococcus tauri TaxID=70448 RepID=A0A090MC67_OSTTA|nr:Helicase, C-terminal [Ostreococcus tauri]CEG01169.1 Helicase, C-terminal [Ostreococcus tauri]|eukprot:XP_003075249.2 Helicase, C-terminal [Ostreococcus tauri]
MARDGACRGGVVRRASGRLAGWRARGVWLERDARSFASSATARDGSDDDDGDDDGGDSASGRGSGKSSKAKRVTSRESLRRLMDMRDPAAWYPLARSMRREITLHVGPTNSGKTHAAMERLKQAASGVYCAPLRLLAWEISESMNAVGVACTLVTGQEIREAPNARHVSSTVEMSDVSSVYDCAVIDEVQLLSDPHRGYAYTRALLGLAAIELHLCGDPRVVPLVKKIVESTGDLLTVKEYERLSPLEVSSEIVKSVKDVREGDALVAFSRADVYKMKRELEKKSNFRACVIYGALPPEARSRQALLFNKPESGYDVLIASDAIGMGLNLNVRRVIFTTMSKFDGVGTRHLEAPEVRQIAGRAGRYGLDYAGGGSVTTMKRSEHKILVNALEGELKPLDSAGIAPSLEQVEEYCAIHRGASLLEALQALSNKAKLASHYRMRNMSEPIAVAKMLKKFPLALEDQFTFAIAPVDVKDPMVCAALLTFVKTFCTHGRVGVRLISLPPPRTPKNPIQLQKLESAHKCLDLYLWLARKLPKAFPEPELADAYRTATATAISAGLQFLSTISDEKNGRKEFDGDTSYLSKSAVKRAFNAAKVAIENIEEERARAGLPRIDQAERAVRFSDFKWTNGGKTNDEATKLSSRIPKSKSSRVSDAKHPNDQLDASPPPPSGPTKKSFVAKRSFAKPSWL